VVGPAELMPSGVEDWPVEVMSDLDAVIEGAPDALMMLRIQRERIKGEHQPASGDYVRNYCLTTERADRLPSHSLVMHPGPMNRGVEIASDVADSPRSVVLEQVRQGVAVRMAVLFNLWGGEK
ncbi:MAG: aspartate carbamoyltransferase, partial [Pontimonas sp.]